MKRIAWSVALLPVLASVAAAAGQNLLVNPGFDSDLSGWTVVSSSDITVTWTGTTGASAPGAAQLDVNAANARNTLVLTQCVAVAPSTNYDFSAEVRFPSGVGEVPTGRIQVQWFSDGGCLDALNFVVSSSTVNSPDTWQKLTASAQTSSAIAESALVSTVLMLPAAGTSRLWFDDIAFAPSATPAPAQTWVPVASHNPGKNHSQWRSDLGLLNTGAVAANVRLRFHGTGGVVSGTTAVAPKTQSLLTDVVAQIGGADSGAIEVLSDQPLRITARSYNLVASDQGCYPNGTQGQNYPALLSSDGLRADESAYLGGLAEDAASCRCNIGLVNTGTQNARVLVQLFDGAGTELAEYTVTLVPGEWKQEQQPFYSKAGQTALERGYAKVTVQSGWGVFAFASVVDAITNDPTTVSMQR